MNKRIKIPILLFSLVYFSVAVFICANNYFVSKNTILNETSSSTCAKLSASNDVLFQQISSLSNIIIELSDNYELKELLKSYGELSLVEQFYADKKINELMSKYYDVFIEISTFKAYIEGKIMPTASILSTDSVKNMPWFERLQSTGYTIDMIPTKNLSSNYPSDFRISLVSAVEDAGRKLGYLQITLANDYILNNFLSPIKSTPLSASYLINNEGNVVAFHPGLYNNADTDTSILSGSLPNISESKGAGFIKNGRFLICYSHDNGYGLKTAEIIDCKSITSVKKLKTNSVVILIILLAISSITVYLTVLIVNKSVLVTNYQIEYQLLREKMNPHFLYNILDAIIWKNTSEVSDINNTLSSLATLYRKTLAIGTYSTVENELNYVQIYLDLTKEYLNENIKFEIDCPSELKSLYIPGFIIQPLIENAIKHGFTNKVGDCIIKIKVRAKEHLEFLIYDNGNGMSQERIDAVFSSTEKHTGISNIQKRIHMLCGKKYGITYDSSLTEFTIAIINLPVLKENPEHS